LTQSVYGKDIVRATAMNIFWRQHDLAPVPLSFEIGIRTVMGLLAVNPPTRC
jgi:hypothetical protein